MEETKVEAVEVAVPVKGTKELIEVIDLMLDGHSLVKQAMADGKIGLDDAALIFKLIPSVGPAINGLSEVPAEVKDLSGAEAADVIAHVMAKLSVEDAKARAIIEAAVKLAADVVILTKAIKA